MHGETMNEKRRNVAELVDFLEPAGYVNIMHVDTCTPITSTNPGVAIQGRLYIPLYPRRKRSCRTREHKPWFSAAQNSEGGTESNAHKHIGKHVGRVQGECGCGSGSTAAAA